MIHFFSKLYKKIYEHAEKQAYPYVAYGWFQTISNPLFYLTWVYFDHQSYENLGIRIGINLLCLPLALKNFWPNKWLYYLPLYWYITALYTLPFFFTFILLKNDFSTSWTLAALTGVVLCILLLDFAALIILLPLGISIGWVCFYVTTAHFVSLATNYKTIIISYACVIIFGAIFAQRKEVIQKEKLDTIQSLVGTVAHELRTPLRIINSSVTGLKDNFPALIETYRIAQNANLKTPKIDVAHYEVLQTALDSIESESEATFNFINMLLMNSNQATIAPSENICSIVACINKAILHYPFDLNDGELLHVNLEKDFQFKGDEALVIHVIYNLMKNSLYYVKAAGKGQIYLSTEITSKKNILYFEDTGQGIPPKVLPHIFERFYSRTLHGTGIGLAFCKSVMESIDGDISCTSEEAKFTKFTLTFPKISS